MFKHYLTLTKPRISMLFALTGLSALLVEGSLNDSPWRLWGIVLAIFLVGGSANALNQYFEKDIDKKMARTAKKRPLPMGKITPLQALIFSIVIGSLGTGILLYWGGFLAFVFGIGTIIFYSFYYTLWLKPRTPYNIVIGGVAGATGPLIAWAAATGHVAWIPFIMFLIIFFWTPPHFWALALCCKEDYKAASYPMLPLVVGDELTRKQILYYSFTLIPLSISLYWFDAFSAFYLWGALLLSVLFVAGAFRIYLKKTTRVSWQFFGYSILYLLVLFILMIIDVVFFVNPSTL